MIIVVDDLHIIITRLTDVTLNNLISDVVYIKVPYNYWR